MICELDVLNGDLWEYQDSYQQMEELCKAKTVMDMAQQAWSMGDEELSEALRVVAADLVYQAFPLPDDVD